MNRLSAQFKASYLQLRIYLWIIVGIVAIAQLADLIVSISLGRVEKDSVSETNFLMIFLLFVPTILPTVYFIRIINLGASRKEYYQGLFFIYAVWSAIFALLNIVWLKLESVVFGMEGINLLEIFKWDQLDLFGVFIYQFGAYMMFLSLLNLLFSGFHHIIGWVLWGLVIAAIPLSTAISSFRSHVADGLQTLLSNDSLMQGFGLTLLFTCVFLAGGWYFVKNRQIP
ncbi:hypothetical protein IM700_003505 [Paenibacillus sp. DXFW5]|uniref:DUF4052 domain-containing protein n=1 Tax=Paenibacillus rhizolycopersici TaxID=2780073 RepID=A0ABS2H0A5_9BACL|nr:hypothetical protein [Paenibacillus rhizolycopersici]MBM6994727.1 hypothetical protein [Paenibacillus rhizolycopersici]